MKIAIALILLALLFSSIGCANTPRGSNDVSQSDSETGEYCVFHSRCEWCNRSCGEGEICGVTSKSEKDKSSKKKPTHTVDGLHFCSQGCADRYLAVKKRKLEKLEKISGRKKNQKK